MYILKIYYSNIYIYIYMLCNALLLLYVNNVNKTMQVPGIFIRVIFYDYVS